jgi:hypothetical protein
MRLPILAKIAGLVAVGAVTSLITLSVRNAPSMASATIPVKVNEAPAVNDKPAGPKTAQANRAGQQPALTAEDPPAKAVDPEDFPQSSTGVEETKPVDAPRGEDVGGPLPEGMNCLFRTKSVKVSVSGNDALVEAAITLQDREEPSRYVWFLQVFNVKDVARANPIVDRVYSDQIFTVKGESPETPTFSEAMVGLAPGTYRMSVGTYRFTVGDDLKQVRAGKRGFQAGGGTKTFTIN